MENIIMEMVLGSYHFVTDKYGMIWYQANYHAIYTISEPYEDASWTMCQIVHMQLGTPTPNLFQQPAACSRAHHASGGGFKSLLPFCQC
jgi:hypothetical protein